MAEGNNLLKEKAQLLEQIKRIQTDQGVEAAKLDGAYQKAIGRLKEIVKIIKASEVAQQKTADSVTELVSGAQSLSSVYKRISTQQEKQAVQTTEISNSLAARIDSNSKLSGQNATAQQQANGILQAYADQASIAAQIAQLTGDDVEQKQQLQSEFDLLGSMIQEELGSMDKRLAVTKDFLAQQGQIAASVQTQIKDAQNLSALTQEQKDILEEQAAVFESMKKKVDALGSTLTTFLKRPQAAIGALVIGIGKFAGKFGEVNRELGQSFLQGLNSSTMSATALGFIFDDTAGTVRELASEFGGVDAATFSTQANIGLMAMNMGISNKEAVGLTASFARMNGGSTYIAADMIKTTQEFAHQNGIIPAALMQDLAGATEEFALFGKDGGQNILRAAGYAQKLGVNMKTLSGIADNLLDFETSITKELELGAMLGRDINLDRARALAYEGDIEGATKETLRALGGIESFNKMDYFQKKQTADLLGVSVAELQKMADNQGKAGELGAIMNEKFSKAGELINGGLNKWLGTSIEGLGGMITMSGQLGTGFKALGMDMGKVAGSIGKGLKDLLMWPVKKIGGLFGGAGKKATESVTSKAKDSISEKITGGGDIGKKGGIMDSMSKIKMSEVLKGAAAMLVVAAAVFVFGKAVQEFMKVSWEAVGMAVVSMLALVGAVALLGAIMMSGVGAVAIIAGAAAMLLIASAVLVLGIGLQAIGKGFEMLSSGIAAMVPNIIAMVGLLAPLILLVPVIAGLAGAFGLLGLSLAFLGVAGLPGLFILAGITALAAPIIKLASLLGIGGEGETVEGGTAGDEKDKTQLLIDEIHALRQDLINGKIGVYMDGVKVTSAIANANEKFAGNSYGIA